MKAALRARTRRLRPSRRRMRALARSSMTANPTRTNQKNSPTQIRPRTVSGGRAAVDVAADGAGAAGRKMVWQGRLPTNSGRRRIRKWSMRSPISTAFPRSLSLPLEASLPIVQPESIAPPAEEPHIDQAPQEPVQEPVHAAAAEETAQEPEKTARRRSTVREKVSFLVDAPQPVAAEISTEQSQPEPQEPEPAPAQAATESTTETAPPPRKAGWWSRRFGGGE